MPWEYFGSLDFGLCIRACEKLDLRGFSLCFLSYRAWPVDCVDSLFYLAVRCAPRKPAGY
jgi:hypothetical protein